MSHLNICCHTCKLTSYLNFCIHTCEAMSDSNICIHTCDAMSNLNTCGWSGGAKVLGKLSVPGRPTTLNYSRARAYCACSRCGLRLFGQFSLVYHFSLLSPSVRETARYRLKYCLKGPLNPKQPINQREYLHPYIRSNEQIKYLHP